jgi:hypothetical protein
MLASRKALLSALRALCVLGAIGGAALGCSLTTDLEPLEAGDSALDCANDEKICDDEATGRGFCVTLDVPKYGCDNPSCRPCTLVGVDVARCDSSNRCVVSVCKDGWQDCDEDGLDCEVDTRDSIANCGHCFEVCDQQHSFNSCVNGVCVLSGCSPGWADCDGNQVNGCEAETGLSEGETNPCPS